MSFELRAKEYKILGIHPTKVICQRYPDLELVDFPPHRLVSEAKFFDKPRPGRPPKDNTIEAELDLLPEKQRDIVSERFEMIKPLILLYRWKIGDQYAGVSLKEIFPDLIKDENNKPALEDLIKIQAKQFNISKRTIWRLWKNWRSTERLDSLISRQGVGVSKRSDSREIRILDPKNGNVLHTVPSRLEERLIYIIEQELQNSFLDLLKLKYSQIYQNIKTKCKISEPVITVPHESTIRKIIKKIKPEVLLYHREGVKVFESKFSLVERGWSNEEALFSLHIVQMDYKRLDEMVVDDIFGLVIDKPWLLLGIDTFSRNSWTFSISWKEPSINTVRSALEFGILPKNTREMYGTENNWDVYGIPKIIYVDNGFKSKELRRIVSEVLGAELRFRPPGEPPFGGAMERIFKTIDSKIIHTLPGTTKSNVKDKGVYNSEKNACIRLSTLINIVAEYLTDIYPYEVNKGLPPDNPIPYLQYLKGLEMGLPDFIPSDEYEEFKIALLEEKFKPVTVDGIRYDNIFYTSREIQHLVKGRGHNYKVKFDYNDVSYCLVLDPELGKRIRVEATNPPIATVGHMDRETWNLVYKKIVDLGLEKAGNVPATKHVHFAYQKIKQQVLEDYKRSKKARKMSAKMNLTEQQPEASSNPVEKDINNLFAELLEYEKECNTEEA